MLSMGGGGRGLHVLGHSWLHSDGDQPGIQETTFFFTSDSKNNDPLSRVMSLYYSVSSPEVPGHPCPPLSVFLGTQLR